jgi:PPK2 family polyphosphate:nucleotide phosphotransferase
MATLTPHPLGLRLDLSDSLAAPPLGLPQKKELEDRFDALGRRLDQLQSALAAEGTRALLVILQGRDASGKDGTIKRVFGSMGPAHCRVVSFKRPTSIDLEHDYLWRIHAMTPPRGVVGVFNRSHYEDLLPVRVHRLVPEDVWRRRYDHINAFERMLSDEGTVIRKFFLHISKNEQLERLNERLDQPSKNWKFALGDLKERGLWDAYSEAYAEMLERCSTAWAPWYIVPADKNKPRDFLVAEAVVEALEGMNPQYPAADPAVLALRGTLT